MSAVPAWKRLGLKLKGPSADGSPVSTVSQPTTPSAPPAARPSFQQQQPSYNSSYNSGGGQYGDYDNGTPFNKRKQQFPSSYPSSDNKRPRRDDSDFNSNKKVSFSQDTKKAVPKKPKKKKALKPQKPREAYDFAPVVEYLRTWHTARDSWKFNKNHQTLMIKHLYTTTAIPSSDIDIFYQYISDIKGGSRKRLVEEAKDIIKKDMEAGLKGFPAGTKADKQKKYEEILADLLKKKAEIKNGATVNGNGKRSFDEVEFVLRTTDKDVQQRVVKRMRAEVIAEELDTSDSSESTDVSTTVSTTSSRIVVPVNIGAASADNDKVAPKPKKVRRKKQRGGADSSSSGSDSDSDPDSSDSDSGSDGPATAGGVGCSSSSSDSDSDEEMETGNGVPNADVSSSSSSSSESGSDSGDGDSESSDDE